MPKQRPEPTPDSPVPPHAYTRPHPPAKPCFGDKKGKKGPGVGPTRKRAQRSFHAAPNGRTGGGAKKKSFQKHSPSPFPSHTPMSLVRSAPAARLRQNNNNPVATITTAAPGSRHVRCRVSVTTHLTCVRHYHLHWVSPAVLIYIPTSIATLPVR